MEDDTRKKMIMQGLYEIFEFVKRMFFSLLLILKENIRRAFDQLKGA